MWGMPPSRESRWERISENGDLVFFYAGRPVSGVVGCATVCRKFRDSKPQWSEEKRQRKAVWPLRFEFEFKFRIDPAFWNQQRIHLSELQRFRYGGFQELPLDIAQKLLVLFPATASTGGINLVEHTTSNAAISRPENSHGDAKSSLVEIGRMQSFIAETEYPVFSKRLDVVWRRLELSVPSHVFEVQVGGNLTEAMGKLKQAHELWNSRILLVGTPGHRSSFNQLVGGSFREIGGSVKFVELTCIHDLYQRKRAYQDLESQLGILS
jgi:hypothetical protein